MNHLTGGPRESPATRASVNGQGNRDVFKLQKLLSTGCTRLLWDDTSRPRGCAQISAILLRHGNRMIVIVFELFTEMSKRIQRIELLLLLQLIFEGAVIVLHMYAGSKGVNVAQRRLTW
jgi:hypothetical protein